MRGVHNVQLKKKAIILRKKGFTYPMIEKELFVPRATLSNWLSGLMLSDEVNTRLLDRKKNNLIKIRGLAVDAQKIRREQNFKNIKDKIEIDFKNFDFSKNALELLLAMLYLGEGFKKTRSHIGLGNSDPKIALMFVKFLRSIYKVEDYRLRCALHLRMDHNAEKEKAFWSDYLGISKKYFQKPQFDKRTEGKKTWEGYHGVCSVYCYDAKIEKRLIFLQKYLVNKILGV
ncbi:MAG: hypothetical protein US58_C0015G0015 [Candidatus Magasanikbacteria bacterium GW2011_GWA2_37_8]|uniref:Uncharacterized protein n=1 Tax=Candidatus Magasanikbacteria bacterium GW2011_GWA2_37_8 TaxID=1619036 RepID=A0A0G0HEL7_9BACT|nr:MAG: hypothetical protein US58_C0015G0015 [Candidatus Magasanikbacteria bacterium GW2011_GWA2_37_8]